MLADSVVPGAKAWWGKITHLLAARRWKKGKGLGAKY